MARSGFDLDGKVVVITGASSGLGVEFAKGFAEAGARVVLGARRMDRLEQTRGEVEEIGAEAIALAVDVSDPVACERLAQVAEEHFGAVDVLINNAGIGTAVPALRETPDEFQGVIDVNLNGSYFMAQSCGRRMRPGSSIVNVSSVLGLSSQGLPQAAYSSSKAAIIGLTRDLAQQWTGRKGIRVNALAPGFFVSEMTDAFSDDYAEEVLRRVPAGRMGRLREIVDPALFLASDLSSYITGVVLPVDGGALTW